MNPKDVILKNIQKHISLKESEETYFLKLLKHRKVKKRQFLLHENEISNFTAFVTTGCLRSYSIDKNGFEHILQFAPTDWWIGDVQSLIFREQGVLNVDAIEDSEALLLFRNDQLELFDKHPIFERFFRIIMEKALASARQRLMDNLSLNAQERYKSFCNLYPSLINALPQKHIAAYIGVTPEFLSKIKANSLKKQIH